MAGQSSKKLAAANEQTLYTLHMRSAVANGVLVLAHLLLRRPANYWPTVLLTIPSLLLETSLELLGRPDRRTDATSKKPYMVRAGEEIREGFYEYYFDIIYITWILNFLAVILGTNKVFYVYLAIPGYATYKIVTLALPFIIPSFQKGDKAREAKESAPEKSKRQAKLENRQQKGQNVKYR